MLYSVQRLAGVDSRLVAFAWSAAQQLPFDIHVLDKGGLRTDADQAALYAMGRTAPGSIVTNASDASTSAHGSGLAIDLAPYDLTQLDTDWSDPDLNSKLSQIGSLAQAAGFTWGGDPAFIAQAGFTDLPHVEIPDWRDEVDNGSAGPGVIGTVGNSLGLSTTWTMLILTGFVLLIGYTAYLVSHG